MEKKRRIRAVWESCRRAAALALAAGFFGILYPDLCLTRDTCRVVCEAGECEAYKDGGDTGDLYYRLLSAKPEQIIIKSRLWEAFSAYFKRDQGE